jgi:YidC/Oxa1 family membrane protein insertase
MQSQDPDQQRNLLLAVVLSMAVLLAWQMFYAGPKMKEEQAARQRAVEQQQTVAPGQKAGEGAITAPGGAVPGTAPASATPLTREDALKSTPRLAIETPSLNGSINLKGGRIDDLKLIRYHVTVDPKSPHVTLLSPANAPEPYFAEYGWLPAAGPSVKLPGSDTVWSARSRTARMLRSPSLPMLACIATAPSTCRATGSCTRA